MRFQAMMKFQNGSERLLLKYFFKNLTMFSLAIQKVEVTGQILPKYI